MRKINTNLSAPVLFLLVLAAAANGQSKPVSPVDTFWGNLQKLCGKAYAGTIAADTSNSPDFAGKALVMHVRSCERNRIRIPFFVGDDRSRTWVLTRKKDRITLKHDHRHEDGKPDKVTMYGGTTNNSGMATRQFFPADEQTTKVVEAPAGNAPSAAANIWWIELLPGEYYTYNLRRLGGDRLFTVKFDLTKPVVEPPAPVGGGVIDLDSWSFDVLPLSYDDTDDSHFYCNCSVLDSVC